MRLFLYWSIYETETVYIVLNREPSWMFLFLTDWGTSCPVTSHCSSDALGSCFSENLFNNEIATDSADIVLEDSSERLLERKK